MKRDVISIEDISDRQLEEYLSRAAAIEALPVERKWDMLKGKVLGILFYEASTRTRLSFESAMMRLGGRVTGFSEVASSSVSKGESLADTIKTVERYCDAIVIRHPREGSARLAAEVSRVPVINAGDGSNQHPTQTLLDLYAMRTYVGRLDRLKIAMVGDLKYSRTVHSLVQALLRYPGQEFLMVSPSQLRMPKYLLEMLSDRNISFRETDSLEEAVRTSDCLYMTRIQRERFPDPVDYEIVKDSYRLDRKLLLEAKPHLKILHPLPRVNEIAVDVDSTPHAAYFDQVECGLVMRQGILSSLLGGVM